MKNILTFFVLLVICPILKAQTISLRDKSSLKALSGAEISSSSLKLITDNKGEVDLSSVAVGTQLLISKQGYASVSIEKTSSLTNETVIYLSERVFNIDEVVISASKFEEKISDVPQQMQVISANDISFANQANAAELLQNSGSVLVQKSQGGGGSPIMRGFEANKVLLVVDGVRMNNAIYRGGHLQNVISLDNNILEKTELVFGPGSVVYGSDALGGVMHFYTKQAKLSKDTDKPFIEANLMSRYSSAFDEKTGHFDFNIGTDKIASLTSFTASDFGDLRQGNVRSPFAPDFGKRSFYVERINGVDSALVNSAYNVQKQSGYKQYDFVEKIKFVQSERVSHLLNFQYSTTSNIPRYDRLAELRNGAPRQGEWYYGPQKRFLVSYTLQLEESKFYDKARLIASLQDIEETRIDRSYRSSKLNSRIENVKVYALNADFEKQLGKNELRYGAEFAYNDVQSTAFAKNINTGEISALNTRYPVNGSSMNYAGIYASHTIELNEKLVLSDGIRFSQVGLQADFSDKTFFPFPLDKVKQNNSAVNGNLGLVYSPGSDWRLSILGSSGFRAPNIDDLSKVFDSVKGDTLGTNSKVGTVILPNPALKPEYTYNTEIGISKVFNKGIQLSANAYYTAYRNAISTQNSTFLGQEYIAYGDTLARVQQNLNNAKAYIYGGSVNLKADVTQNFSIISSVNYTFGRIKTDTTDYPLDHIAPIFGQTSFLLNVKKFKTEFFVRYSGWKRLKDYNLSGEDNYAQATVAGMPAWVTLNLRTAYQFTKTIGVQVSVENLLDQNYRVFASGISAPGRNLIISLRANL